MAILPHMEERAGFPPAGSTPGAPAASSQIGTVTTSCQRLARQPGRPIQCLRAGLRRLRTAKRTRATRMRERCAAPGRLVLVFSCRIRVQRFLANLSARPADARSGSAFGLAPYALAVAPNTYVRGGFHSRRGQCAATCTKSLSVVSMVNAWRMQSCANKASMVPICTPARRHRLRNSAAST